MCILSAGFESRRAQNFIFLSCMHSFCWVRVPAGAKFHFFELYAFFLSPGGCKIQKIHFFELYAFFLSPGGRMHQFLFFLPGSSPGGRKISFFWSCMHSFCRVRFPAGACISFFFFCRVRVPAGAKFHFFELYAFFLQGSISGGRIHQ